MHQTSLFLHPKKKYLLDDADKPAHLNGGSVSSCISAVFLSKQADRKLMCRGHTQTDHLEGMYMCYSDNWLPGESSVKYREHTGI